MNQESNFKQWCLVELFGHQKIAGLCSEQNIAGTNMLRVDVPETEKQPAFTKYFGSAAIYAINPIDETTCKSFAEGIQAAPVSPWQGESFIEKYNASRALTASTDTRDLEQDGVFEGNNLDRDVDW